MAFFVARQAGTGRRCQARVTRERQPQLVVAVIEAADVAAEVLRCHAGNDVIGLVDLDPAPDDPRIAVEAHLPDAVPDHRFRFGARRIVDLGEARSEEQRHTDGREVVARHVHRRDRYRRGPVRGPIEPVATAPAGDAHRAGRVADVEVVGERPRVEDRAPRLREQLAGGTDHELDQAPIVDSRRRRDHHPRQQQNRDHDAHPEAERHDAHRGEGAGAGERARGMEKVGEGVAHGIGQTLYHNEVCIRSAEPRADPPAAGPETTYGRAAAGVPSRRC